MSLVAWILLGELLLVSVVAAVMAVVAGRVRQRRLVTAVAAMLDRLRSGESRRVKALSTRLAELYRLEAAAAEQLAQAVVAEEKRCTGALARALLGKDKDALKNLGDSLVKLSDRQLTETAAALAERLEALSKLDQGLAAAVPPEEGRGFSADQAGMPDVAEPVVAVEVDAEPGDGLVLEDSSRGDRDGPDGQSDPIPDLMPATEQAEQLSAALDLDGAPPIGLDGEGESAGADVGAGSGQRAGPEPVAARDRKARRRAADRPANPLWGIAPSDSGIPDELADTQQDSWERAGNQSADPSEESHDEAAEADPIPAMPGTDPSASKDQEAATNSPDKMNFAAAADPALQQDVDAPTGDEAPPVLAAPFEPVAGQAAASLTDVAEGHSALADLEAALAEFEAQLPVLRETGPPTSAVQDESRADSSDAVPAESAADAEPAGLAINPPQRQRSTRRRNKKSQSETAEQPGQDG